MKKNGLWQKQRNPPPSVSAVLIDMKTTFVITTLIIACVILPHPAIADLEIRQEVYEFNKMATRNVSCVTFMITKTLVPDDLPTTCYLSIIPFELGSAVLSPTAEKIMLADLSKCEVLQKVPLTVTGHTCIIGSERLNKVLSLQRAEAVAKFLQDHGFTVAMIQGKDSQVPFCDEITELYRNRRVEITQNPEQQ